MKIVASILAGLVEVGFVFVFVSTIFALLVPLPTLVVFRLLAISCIFWILNIGMVPPLRAVGLVERRNPPTPSRRKPRRRKR